MAQNAANVAIPKPKTGGAVYSAAAGSALPSSAEGDLPAAYNSLGYLSEDGITIAFDDETESITAFGGDTVLTVRTSHSETATFTPLEQNVYALAATYGEDNVTVSGDGLTILHNGKERVASPWVFDMALSNDMMKRIVVPLGKIVEVGEVGYKNGEPIAPELTLAMSPDSAGNTAYEYNAAVGEGIVAVPSAVTVAPNGTVIFNVVGATGTVTATVSGTGTGITTTVTGNAVEVAASSSAKPTAITVNDAGTSTSVVVFVSIGS